MTPCGRWTSPPSGSRSSPRRPAPAFWQRPAEEVAAVRERYGLPDRYLLWVGDDAPARPAQAGGGAGPGGPLDAARARRAGRADGPASCPGCRSPARSPTTSSPPSTAAPTRWCSRQTRRGSGCRRWRRWPAAPRWPRATSPRCARCWPAGSRSPTSTTSTASSATPRVCRAPGAAPRPWSWNDVAAATWEVYERALLAPLARTPPRSRGRRAAPAAPIARRRD